uniref:Cullin N-terminal domain-containing protein n=1 Tax=Plectus sambesii TaxID=2011161 RepID=A0A914WHQ2_9BILA
MTAAYALRPKVVDFEGTWRGLEESINRIINLQSIDRHVWDDCFHDIYSLCVAIPDPLSEQLYMRTRHCLEAHVRRLYQIVSASQEVDLLSGYYNHWQVYHKGATFIHNLFGYLNKQFIKSRRQAESDLQYGPSALPADRDCQMMEIGELALSIWNQLMVTPLEAELVRQLLLAITADRNGDSTANVDVVKGVIMSFVQVEEFSSRQAEGEQLSLYKKVFEEKFLTATSDHYQAEASRLLAECTVSQYMEKVIQRIDDENMRSRKFLHSSSFEKVTKMCQEVMVSAHKDRLYAVCREMVHNESKIDLKNMYTLLKPIVQGLTVLIKEFEQHVKKSGLDGVQNLKGDNVPQQFVENILAVHHKFNALVAEVFSDDGDFVGALDKALQSAVNFKEESRSCPKASEWVRYCWRSFMGSGGPDGVYGPIVVNVVKISAPPMRHR